MYHGRVKASPQASSLCRVTVHTRFCSFFVRLTSRCFRHTITKTSLQTRPTSLPSEPRARAQRYEQRIRTRNKWILAHIRRTTPSVLEPCREPTKTRVCPPMPRFCLFLQWCLLSLANYGPLQMDDSASVERASSRWSAPETDRPREEHEHLRARSSWPEWRAIHSRGA